MFYFFFASKYSCDESLPIFLISFFTQILFVTTLKNAILHISTFRKEYGLARLTYEFLTKQCVMFVFSF